MVTIEEFRGMVDIKLDKSLVLRRKISQLSNFLDFIKNLISEENEFNSTIDIDALITQQTPKYNDLKAAVDTAYNDFQ